MNIRLALIPVFYGQVWGKIGGFWGGMWGCCRHGIFWIPYRAPGHCRPLGGNDRGGAGGAVAMGGLSALGRAIL